MTRRTLAALDVTAEWVVASTHRRAVRQQRRIERYRADMYYGKGR
jgi:hypothetical protein